MRLRVKCDAARRALHVVHLRSLQQRGHRKCVKLELIPEPAGKGTSKADKAKFEGLFGLRGAIELYVDETTGVPVKIAGDLPAGIFTFQVEVNLKSFKGTPEGFAPTKAAK